MANAYSGIIVPFNYNEGINKGISEGLKEAYLNIIKVLIKGKQLSARRIADELEKPYKTIERQISVLKEIGAIEFKGAKRTGGYEVTDALLKYNK